MKILKYTLLTLLALIVIVLVAGWLYLEPMVKGVVHKFGTQIVGTEVNLAGFSLHPLDGELEISGFTVANPEGYETPNLLSLGNIFVKVDPKSVLSDTIVVEEVRILKPELTYEMPNFSTSNVQQLQENVARNTAKSGEAKPVEAKAEEPAATESAPAKKVIIRKVTVAGGSLSAMTPLQKNTGALALEMPAIELTDIGDESKSMSINESVTVIFNKILFNATSVVTKALGNVSDMAQKAANKAVDQVKDSVKEEAGGLLDKVKFW